MSTVYDFLSSPYSSCASYVSQIIDILFIIVTYVQPDEPRWCFLYVSDQD